LSIPEGSEKIKSSAKVNLTSTDNCPVVNLGAGGVIVIPGMAVCPFNVMVRLSSSTTGKEVEKVIMKLLPGTAELDWGVRTKFLTTT